MSTVEAWHGWALAGVSIVAAVFWWWWLDDLGINMTNDSTSYLLEALRIQSSGTLDINALWPPLYPLAIRTLMPTGSYPADAATILAGLVMGGTLAAASFTSLRTTGSFLVALVFGLFFCVWSPTIYVFRMVWSEAMYTALLMVHLWVVLHHTLTGKRTLYVLAAVTAVATALTRYIGDSLVLTFGLYSLLYLYAEVPDRRERINHLLIFGVSCLPIPAWLAFNWIRAGTLHGAREPGFRSLGENLVDLFEAFRQAFWITPLLSTLVIGALAGAIVVQRLDSPLNRFIRYLLGYIAVYMAMLIYASTMVSIDGITVRLVSPVLPAIVLLIPAVLGALREATPEPVWTAARLTVVGALVIGAVGGAGQTRVYLEELTRSIDNQGFHMFGGFMRSETAPALHRAIAARVAKTDRLAVMVFTDNRNGVKGVSLWTRSMPLEGDRFSLEAFEVLEDSNDMLLKLDDGGTPREIYAYVHSRIKQPGGVRRNLVRMAKATNQEDLVVITHVSTLRKLRLPRPDLATLNSRGTTCTLGETIDGYQIYDCNVQPWL